MLSVWGPFAALQGDDWASLVVSDQWVGVMTAIWGSGRSVEGRVA